MYGEQEGGGWRKKIWNPEKREFLGRTAESWLQITMFYVIFYAFLCGVFIMTTLVLLMTLCQCQPKYQDKIVPSGLSFKPYATNFDIIFKKDDPSSYEAYVKSLKTFIEQYNDDKQTNDTEYENCGASPKPYSERGDHESNAGLRKSCRFSRKVLQGCSGQSDTSFGFKEGKPCLIVKLNRVIEFRPKPPSINDSLPDDLKGKSFDNFIPVHCTCLREQDKGNLGEVKYFGFAGRGGFPLQYYPYYGKLLQPNYLQPLVGVKFTNLTVNKDIHVQCRVYGGDWPYQKTNTRSGLFNVRLTVKQ